RSTSLRLEAVVATGAKGTTLDTRTTLVEETLLATEEERGIDLEAEKMNALNPTHLQTDRRKRRRSPSPQSHSHSHSHRSKPLDPLKLDYLLPFRQYAEYIRSTNRSSTLEDQDMRKMYGTYREDYYAKLLAKFFDEHKGLEWMREKYHPVESKEWKDAIKGRKAEAYLKYLEDLEKGVLDGVGFDEKGSDAKTAPVDAADAAVAEDEKESQGAEEGGKSGSTATLNEGAGKQSTTALFIKNLTGSVKRQQILDLVKDVEGFKHLALADPRPDKRYQRFGWVVFTDGTDLEKAMGELNNKKMDDLALQFSPYYDHGLRTKVIPAEFNTAERVEKDLDAIRKLAAFLDAEFGLDSLEGAGCEALEKRLEVVVSQMGEDSSEEVVNGEETGDKLREDEEARGLMGESPVKTEPPSGGTLAKTESVTTKKNKKRLDMYIDYLRRVHWFDYYSTLECDSPEDFNRKATIHLRPHPSTSSSSPSKPTTSTSTTTISSDFHRFSDRLDSRLALRTTPHLSPDFTPTPPFLRAGGKDPHPTIDTDPAYLPSKVLKIEDEKYRCAVCQKLFRGDEYVKKHVRSKHPELVEGWRVEVDYLNGFVRDVNRAHYAVVESVGGGMMGVQGMQGMMMYGGQMQGMGMGMNMGMGMGMGMGHMGMMGGGMNMMGIGMGMGMAGGNEWGMGGGGYGGGGRGGYGGGGRGRGNMNQRLGPRPSPRPSGPMPVDPRAKSFSAYTDLDAPKGDAMDLNYD
ncbi:hypothetical protein HDV05_008306, partial [Chytridiales sp. JEL 0842]